MSPPYWESSNWNTHWEDRQRTGTGHCDRRSACRPVRWWHQHWTTHYGQKTTATTRTRITKTLLFYRPLYTSEWSGRIFWIAIKAINPEQQSYLENFSPPINGVFKGTQGQTVTINIDTDENSRLILANIYAPLWGTWQIERKSFFFKLENTLRDLNCENIILGGDFNCVLNKELDRSHAVTYQEQSSNSLKHLLAELKLEDGWRLHNPDEQVFTHHSHLGSASHIDHIYTSRILRNSVWNTEITDALQASREQCSLATWPTGDQALRQAASTATEAWGSAPPQGGDRQVARAASTAKDRYHFSDFWLRSNVLVNLGSDHICKLVCKPATLRCNIPAQCGFML